MSARTPKSAWAPPGWERNPVTTSSKTSAVPEASVRRRTSLQELARLQLGTAALHRLDEDGRELVAVGLQVVERGSGSP